MSIKIAAVDDNMNLPAAVRAKVAANMADPSTVEGAALAGDLAAIKPKPIYLRPGDFEIGAATPVKEIISGRFPAWTLRDSVGDRISTTFNPPARYGVVDVDVFWVKKTGSATGDVVFRALYSPASVGSSPTNTTITLPGVVALADQFSNELRRTRVASGIDVSKAMSTLLMIERDGNNAADTYTGDVSVVGVLITPRAPFPGVMTDDGAWYWMNEPYLIADPARTIVYTSFMTTNGDAGVASLNTTTGAKAEATLRSRFFLDDHATPALIVLQDGNLLAIYTPHSVVDAPIRLRRTTTPGDLSSLAPEQQIVLPVGSQPCYPKPAYIGSRLYIFFRNGVWHDYIYSDDHGVTWSAPARFVTGNTGWRPYINYVAKNGRIDFTATDDNPNPTGSYTNLYHFYIDAAGAIRKSDGTLIKTMGTLGADGIRTSDMTKVYDHTTDGDGWCYDIQHDAQGRPVFVFATFANLANHRYYYARWTGSAWSVKPITYAGGTPYDGSGEPRYSGGLGLLASNPNVVFLSRWVRDQLEVERWETTDGGQTWSSEAITRHSAEKNFRPQSPDNHYAGAPEVFWMAGWYSTFVRYHTRLVYKP